jgi:DNA-binding GntR family transcriptional regulator
MTNPARQGPSRALGHGCRPSTGQIIADSLRSEILQDRLMFGDPLLLLSLAAQFGVSVTPVRSALRVLAAENLIAFTQSGYGSAVVVHRSRETIEFAYAVGARAQRQIVECPASRPSSDVIEKLEGLDRMLRVADLEGNRERARALENTIHRLVVTRATTPMRVLLYSVLPLLSWRVPSDVPGWSAIHAQGHGEIIVALRQQDHARAGALMDHHVRSLGAAVACLITR